jgi:hypothetical protein
MNTQRTPVNARLAAGTPIHLTTTNGGATDAVLVSRWEGPTFPLYVEVIGSAGFPYTFGVSGDRVEVYLRDVEA